MPRRSYDYWDDFGKPQPSAAGRWDQSQEPARQFRPPSLVGHALDPGAGAADATAGRLSRGAAHRHAPAARCSTWTSGQAASPRRVQGSRTATRYTVAVELAPLTDDQIGAAAIDAMAEQAIFAAKLLNGEMPPDIEEAFKQANVALFPIPSAGDLRTSCSGPDDANPCKHTAAVYLLLGGAVRRRPVPAVPACRRARRRSRSWPPCGPGVRHASAVAEEPADYAGRDPGRARRGAVGRAACPVLDGRAGAGGFPGDGGCAGPWRRRCSNGLAPCPPLAGPDRSDAMTLSWPCTYDAVTQAALALAFSPGA